VFRVVLAVVLASALLAVALPAVDGARTGNADRAVRGELLAVERGASSLVAGEETTPGAGARRSVPVTLPGASWGRVSVDSVTFHGGSAASAPPRRGRVTYRLDGRDERTATVDAPLWTPDGPVTLRGTGRHRLVLELVRVDGRRVVVVRLPDRERMPSTGTDRRGGGPTRDASRRDHR
jgi:hypothetical protein